MATGRTTLKNYRIYVDGLDMSGYSRSFGPLACTFEEGMDDSIDKDVKAVTLGNATVGMGTLNGIYDNTASTGIHAHLQTAGVERTVLIGIGIQTPPVNNDIAFMGTFNQNGYEVGGSDNPVTVSIPFANTSYGADNLYYARPWGTLLHALAAETAANTAVGLDQAAGTTAGGYMCYQVTAGDGTATLKVQHSTTTNLDGSFGDLLSSGSVDFTGGGKFGIVQLAPTATVGQFVRFQIALGTANSVTFALAFVRG